MNEQKVQQITVSTQQAIFEQRLLNRAIKNNWRQKKLSELKNGESIPVELKKDGKFASYLREKFANRSEKYYKRLNELLLSKKDPKLAFKLYSERFGINLPKDEKSLLVKQLETKKRARLTINPSEQVEIFGNLFINDSGIPNSRISGILKRLGLEIDVLDADELAKPLINVLKKMIKNLGVENLTFLLPGNGSKIPMQSIASLEPDLYQKIMQNSVSIEPQRVLQNGKAIYEINETDSQKLRQISGQIVIIDDVIASGGTIKNICDFLAIDTKIVILTLAISSRVDLYGVEGETYAGVKVSKNGQKPPINTLKNLINSNSKRFDLAWQMLTKSAFTKENKNDFLAQCNQIPKQMIEICEEGLSKLADLSIQVFGESPYFSILNLEREKQYFLETMKKGILLVSYNSNKDPIGALKANIGSEKDLNIDGVFIQKDYRGKGLGGVFMEEIINLAKEKGFERITLRTSNDQNSNREVLDWYAKLGFVPIIDSDTNKPKTTIVTRQRIDGKTSSDQRINLEFRER